MSAKRYIFAAGGTGGHIIPAMAVASALKSREPEARVLFIGAGSPLERKLIEPEFELVTIEFVPVLGKGPLGILRMLSRFPAAIMRAIRLYRQEKPQSIMAFGGYPSFIPFVAAWILGIPRILFEQNVKVGLANKALGLLTSQVYAVPGASSFVFRTPLAYLANPVRPQFLELGDYRAPDVAEPFVVLVMGGSQGASSINSCFLEIATELIEQGVELVHVVGERNLEEVSSAYKEKGLTQVQVHGFVQAPWELIAAAHLIISRAGAGAAAEFLAAARPVVYVPLAIAAAHQSHNIVEQLQKDAAIELEQGSVDFQLSFAQQLKSTIVELKNNPQRLENLAENMRLLRDSARIDETAAASAGSMSVSRVSSAAFFAQKLDEIGSRPSGQ